MVLQSTLKTFLGNSQWRSQREGLQHPLVSQVI